MSFRQAATTETPLGVQLSNLNSRIAHSEPLTSLCRERPSEGSPSKSEVAGCGHVKVCCAPSEGVLNAPFVILGVAGVALGPTSLTIFFVTNTNTSLLKSCYVLHMWGVGLNVERIMI
jgi:hypothetical protein